MKHLKHEQEDYFNILEKDGVNVFASDDNKNILICNFKNEILLQVSIDMFKNESLLIVKEHV